MNNIISPPPPFSEPGSRVFLLNSGGFFTQTYPSLGTGSYHMTPKKKIHSTSVLSNSSRPERTMEFPPALQPCASSLSGNTIHPFQLSTVSRVLPLRLRRQKPCPVFFSSGFSLGSTRAQNRGHKAVVASSHDTLRSIINRLKDPRRTVTQQRPQQRDAEPGKLSMNRVSGGGGAHGESPFRLAFLRRRCEDDPPHIKTEHSVCNWLRRYEAHFAAWGGEKKAVREGYAKVRPPLENAAGSEERMFPPLKKKREREKEKQARAVSTSLACETG